ncbi:hypothetical protein [Bacillus marasmi]|uniref:hypothetical protein n=1 Tax=Bacillus marasmi TaxID=1926279 RepID=UPI0011CA59CA|nr:hypothetical protein [Bacillus marasmi]
MKNDVSLDAPQDLTKLTKQDIGEFLYFTPKEIKKKRKECLLCELLKRLKGNEILLKGLYKKHAEKLGMHPNQVEEYLNITKTERLRWTSQRKLTVVKWVPFKKWGRELEYPLYDTYQIKSITTKMLNKWRVDHQLEVKENRVQAIKKAQQTRHENIKLHKDFYENKWRAMLADWYKTDGKLGASLQLSFWTMWINRWAKEYQLKATKAKKNIEKYFDKKDLFYDMKNEAMQRLIQSPYSSLSFYQPSSSEKITYLEFCSHHFDQWKLDRQEYGYLSKFDFYYNNEADINNCNLCEVEIDDDYYSLYYLTIQHQDYHFSFHTPYPIGSDYLPSKESLPQISHEAQEGIFRFGRSLFEDEKIIFCEKEVIKHFNEAIVKYDLYFGPAVNIG